MKLAKKILLVILSTIPLPMAVSFAAEYSENVETPSVTLINITAEFLRRFERNLLDAKYIEYLEENEIYTVEELNLPENEEIKKIVIDRFLLEYYDERLQTNSVVSVI